MERAEPTRVNVWWQARAHWRPLSTDRLFAALASRFPVHVADVPGGPESRVIDERRRLLLALVGTTGIAALLRWRLAEARPGGSSMTAGAVVLLFGGVALVAVLTNFMPPRVVAPAGRVLAIVRASELGDVDALDLEPHPRQALLVFAEEGIYVTTQRASSRSRDATHGSRLSLGDKLDGLAHGFEPPPDATTDFIPAPWVRRVSISTGPRFHHISLHVVDAPIYVYECRRIAAFPGAQPR